MVNCHYGIGWKFVHLCIDDSSPVALVQAADQRKGSAVSSLRRPLLISLSSVSV